MLNKLFINNEYVEKLSWMICMLDDVNSLLDGDFGDDRILKQILEHVKIMK